MNKIQSSGHDSRQRPQPQEGPLEILFEDEFVLIVNKPAGTVVHPTYKNTSGTLLNAVLWRYRDRPDIQPGILTRLDKDTSGTVVLALTPVLHATMQRDMSAGRVNKEYLAVVLGVPEPPRSRIDLPLGRSPADRRIVVVRDDGAPSVTEYEVLDQWLLADSVVALVRCQLVTGRTHQIRVHLAANGWPIVGDAVYGRPSRSIPRQALHAWRVTFPHPTSRNMVTVSSPLPPDIAALREDTPVD